MKKGKSLSIFALLLLPIAVVLTSCGGDSSEYSLKIWGVNEKVPLNGVWGACYGPGTYDGVTTTTDTMETFTFTGSFGLRQVFSCTSVDTTCSGDVTEIPDENIPFTITVDGEKEVAWSDGSAIVLVPDGLPDTPTVCTLTIDAGAEGTLHHIFYIDERTTPWKMYRPEEDLLLECPFDANGYPSCLMIYDFLVKQ